MKTEWRPDDWIYISGYSDCSSIREAGADDMLTALLKYLGEPCKEHPYYTHGSNREGDRVSEETYYEHRYLCPQCMAELRGE